VSGVEYEVAGAVARLTLNRPDRGNGLTRAVLEQLEQLVERADLEPEVRVLLLSGSGSGFCGGYDLVESAERMGSEEEFDRLAGSPLDPSVIARNHNPSGVWDPMVDYAMMSRNVRSFMSLQRATKPVVCKVHGFCVAGGTDLALCADLLVVSEDAKIGYPPARVWGSPTTGQWAHRLGPQRAKRLLFTGDSLSGTQAAEWGLALEAWPASELDARVDALVARISRLPLNQLQMMKLLCNQWYEGSALGASQVVGTLLDGIARHTEEGYAFQALAGREGFRAAVRRRDEPFGDWGR
jgi:enoyl-CoA hydratase